MFSTKCITLHQQQLDVIMLRKCLMIINTDANWSLWGVNF